MDTVTGDARSHEQDPVARRPLGPAAFVLVMIAVVLATGLSRLVSTSGDVSLVWPPLGIAIGLTLVRGVSGLLAVLAGVVAWILLSGESLRLLPMAIPEIAVGTGVAVWLYRRLLPDRRGALAAVARLYAAGILGGAAASALVGAAGFQLAGLYPDLPFPELFFAFWVTESMGVLLFAALTQALARDGVGALWPDRRLAGQWLLLTGGVLALTLLVRSEIREVAVLLAGLLVCWPAMRARPAFLHLAVLLLMSALLAIALSTGTVQDNRGVLEVVLRIAALTVMAHLLNASSVELAGLLAREQQAARRDALTGLGNGRALRERMASDGDGMLLALRLEDMDSVTDLLGGAATEQLETTLAEDLQRWFDGDAFRRGRGRYAVLLPGQDAARAGATARSLYASLDNRLFVGDGERVALRPSLALVPLSGRPGEEVLLAAELALAVAAANTGTRVAVDAGGQDLVASRREQLRRQEDVKAALAEGRFVLFAQPIVPLHGDPDGLHCEILLRLRQPDGSILPPGYFFAAAERAQLTGAIDRYVIERLLAWLAAHPAALARIGKCAINLTGWSVSDPSLAPWIADRVRAHGIPPEKLCFEITESQAIASREAAHGLIVAMRELGASVSLDDFGTGLATFDYLKSFPFDYLKIDGGFVKTLVESPVDQAIVRAVTEVARSMQLKTIAEFVENDAILARLRDFGVDYAQGYGVGKPQPLAALLGEAGEA